MQNEANKKTGTHSTKMSSAAPTRHSYWPINACSCKIIRFHLHLRSCHTFSFSLSHTVLNSLQKLDSFLFLRSNSCFSAVNTTITFTSDLFLTAQLRWYCNPWMWYESNACAPSLILRQKTIPRSECVCVCVVKVGDGTKNPHNFQCLLVRRSINQRLLRHQTI